MEGRKGDEDDRGAGRGDVRTGRDRDRARSSPTNYTGPCGANPAGIITRIRPTESDPEPGTQKHEPTKVSNMCAAITAPIQTT